nr:MAG TPA: SprT-like family [Bacteriophage sp.]
MEPKIMMKPTKEQYQALQGAFDYFNEKLFKDSLPQVMLTLNRERNTFGYYCPSVWTKAQEAEDETTWGEIALNPDYIFHSGRTERDVYSTLVHEMCHLWQEYDGSAPRRCYHNKDFAEKMERVGLITSNTGEVGG